MLPVALIVGAVMSSVQVAVRVTSVAALPQASETFHLRVCERPQVLVFTTGSDVAVGVPTPQLSVAVAVPRAALISASLGLQPRVKVVPLAVITGAVLSTVQVTMRETGVALLPQASAAVHVLV